MCAGVRSESPGSVAVSPAYYEARDYEYESLILLLSQSMFHSWELKHDNACISLLGKKTVKYSIKSSLYLAQTQLQKPIKHAGQTFEQNSYWSAI